MIFFSLKFFLRKVESTDALSPFMHDAPLIIIVNDIENRIISLI